MLSEETKKQLKELGFMETQFFPAVYIKNDIVVVEVTCSSDLILNKTEQNHFRDMRVMEYDNMLELLKRYETFDGLNIRLTMDELDKKLSDM